MPAFYRTCQSLVLVSAFLGTFSGCLNLGGRTTNVHNNPQTNARLSALETRVNALEQALRTTSVEIPVPVESIDRPDYSTPAAP